MPTVRTDDGRFLTGRPPSREEVLAEIGRELAYRRRCYPKWIAEEKYGLTQQKGDEFIDRLQAAYDYIGEHWPATQQAFPL